MKTTKKKPSKKTAPQPQPVRVSDARIKPLIAVSLGDAAGIGPELCLRLLQRAEKKSLPYQPVIIGDLEVLLRVAAELKTDVRPNVVTQKDLENSSDPRELFRGATNSVVDTEWLKNVEVKPGNVQGACGKASGEFIRFGVEQILSGTFDALTTAPINKEALHLGGFDFPGHTEMLADWSGVPGEESMLLFSERISVGFATLHTSVSKACASLRTEEIVRVGKLMDRYLQVLHGRPVRLGVLALNPHAGENGLFGNEEEEIIRPAVEQLKRRKIMVNGPLVPDATFVPNVVHRFDGFLCMYHDQGSIPFKMLSFDDGVNLTMGLPFVRTSPDHGTAFDIAWKGVASPSSFFAAADLAGKLIEDHGK